MTQHAPDALVSEIRSLYGRRHKDKVAMQKAMIELRDRHQWTPSRIAAETGIPQPTVFRWLRAHDEQAGSIQMNRLTPAGFQGASDRRVARRVLETAPLEDVERVIEQLPPERRQAIAAAAGSAHAQARQAYDERERDLTPAERRERADAAERLTREGRQAVGGFRSLGVVGHIEQATDELRELTADASLTPESVRKIDAADEAWREALDFARALVGGDGR